MSPANFPESACDGRLNARSPCVLARSPKLACSDARMDFGSQAARNSNLAERDRADPAKLTRRHSSPGQEPLTSTLALGTLGMTEPAVRATCRGSIPASVAANSLLDPSSRVR